ncbi:MAG: NAD(+) synthase, partial [Clostridiales Family XIII bacterium]|nr:NAD(+) synthase [Clostridiales Family XIII bacterium]
MVEGFVRVAAVTPEIRVADCSYNARRIEEAVHAAADKGARIVVLPELSITGYTCGDLFLQDTLLESAKTALARLVEGSEGREEVVIVGLPFAHKGKLYNTAAVYSDGELLAFIPKTNLPNYGEFYEQRHFTPAFSGLEYADFSVTSSDDESEDDSDEGGIRVGGSDGVAVIPINYVDDDFFDDDDDDMDDEEEGYYEDIPFGTDIIFKCEDDPDLTFAVEICEDLWSPSPPSVRHAVNGALIIANLSAGNEAIGKASYRRLLTRGQSGRLICGYIYANAGIGESTQDMVFSGHCIIAENGEVIAENTPFGSSRGGIVLSDIDVRGLAHDRRYNSSFISENASVYLGDDSPLKREYEEVLFSQPEFSDDATDIGMAVSTGKVILFAKPDANKKDLLYRWVDPHPFVPRDEAERAARCEEILSMQSSGLAKRLVHTDAKTAIVGVSGGLDSTLALLVAVRAAHRIGNEPETVRAVTMPGFGTSAQTKGNAEKLCEALGVPLDEIDITEQTKVHLKSIGHGDDERDVTYENAQARVRTLVLMDLANKEGGIVVGTGDLSELALGWATYNG